MYKHWTVEELKKILSLPKNYKVDACIIFGGYPSKKFKKMFISALKDKSFKIEKLEEKFIKDTLSIKIGKKRIWFIVEYGGARLSELIHFACMLGSKKNILLGSCGGLKKGLNTSTIIVPKYSYSTESSCHMYLRNKRDSKFYPDSSLSDDAIKILGKELNVTSGPIMTCQAMMAETWGDILKWSKKGFYGVEMEASTVFAVSKHFKVPSTAILQMADNLIEKETVDSQSFKETKAKRYKIRNYLFRTVLKLVLN